MCSQDPQVLQAPMDIRVTEEKKAAKVRSKLQKL